MIGCSLGMRQRLAIFSGALVVDPRLWPPQNLPHGAPSFSFQISESIDRIYHRVPLLLPVGRSLLGLVRYSGTGRININSWWNSVLHGGCRLYSLSLYGMSYFRRAVGFILISLLHPIKSLICTQKGERFCRGLSKAQWILALPFSPSVSKLWKNIRKTREERAKRQCSKVDYGSFIVRKSLLVPTSPTLCDVCWKWKYSNFRHLSTKDRPTPPLVCIRKEENRRQQMLPFFLSVFNIFSLFPYAILGSECFRKALTLAFFSLINPREDFHNVGGRLKTNRCVGGLAVYFWFSAATRATCRTRCGSDWTYINLPWA